MIAALVLAAGGSRRLGRPKQLEPWGDTTLLGKVVGEAKVLEGIDEVWVVLGANLDAIFEKVDLTGCGIIENPEWEDGFSSSLRVGLDAITRLSKAEAVLVMLGDQPGILPEVVADMIAIGRKPSRPAIVPKYRYLRGNPVLIKRSLWSRLMALTGDEGARQLLMAHPEWVQEVWVDSLAPRDVDTGADVEELRPRG
jgi:molybdenum cofactor cytidylyltransferase